jgi:hypothetical protein
MNGDESISWKMLAVLALLGVLVGGVFFAGVFSTSAHQDPLLGGQRGDNPSAPAAAPSPEAPSSPNVPTPPPPPPGPTQVP